MKPLLQTILIITLLAALLTTQASAQTPQPPKTPQTDPVQILQQSAATLQTTPGFSAKLTLSGDGSQMILNTLPAISAKINMGTHPQHHKALHLIGQYISKKDAPPQDFDILYTNNKLIWTDHAKQTINIRPPFVSARQKPAPFKYLMLAELLKDTPFQKEINSAQSIDLQPNQSIAGTDCYVIKITRAPPAPGSRRSGIGAHTIERWFIAVEDHLPRRVEHITDAGMIKATLIMELTNLTIGPQDDIDLDVFRPESYTVSDTTKATPKPTLPDADQPFTRPKTPNTTAQPTAQPTTPSDPPAPNYTFTDINNATITRATQQGRITVLHFFGSWSIPSKHTTPLLSTLAADFQTTTPSPNTSIAVDTYAIAIRESDPESLTQTHNNNNYRHTLAINPPNNLPSLFKVRVYPTIIVIDDNARIIFNQHLTKDRTPQQLIDNAKAAITKALK